jgi:small subunit ribosomal protein S11
MGKKTVKTQEGDAKEVKTTAGAEATVAKAASAASRKAKRVQEGKVYVNATYNNTVVTVTDTSGNVLAWASAGSLGFSGPKKATPFASSKVIAAITEKIQASGPKDISVIVKGIGSGRDSAIRSLINNGFNILSIKDATPVPHNGPRPAKIRRV